MKLDVHFKNFDRSEAIVEVVTQKSQRLEKFFHGDFHIEWNLWVEDAAQHAEIHINRKHMDLHAKAEEDDLYKAIDSAAKKIKIQLEKNKELSMDHRHKKSE